MEREIVYFRRYWNPSFQREHWNKREKRRGCQSSEGFQNFLFLPVINVVFAFALSSPLWHSWYISLSIITDFKVPHHVVLQTLWTEWWWWGLLLRPRVPWGVELGVRRNCLQHLLTCNSLKQKPATQCTTDIAAKILILWTYVTVF